MLRRHGIFRVPTKEPRERIVRAEDEKDSVRQIQSAKMAPDRRNTACKGTKGSRLLCLQDFVSIIIAGVQNSRWKWPDMGCSRKHSRMEEQPGENYRGVKPWVQSQLGNQRDEQCNQGRMTLRPQVQNRYFRFDQQRQEVS